MNILLLGGAGFLGQGLQREFKYRKIQFHIIDKNDIDLFDVISIQKLISIIYKYNNIVILASKLGSKLFETDAKNASLYNKIIHENIIEAIKIASVKYNKSYNITYYSTSEVFNSQIDINSFITNDTDYAFNYNNPRHLYAYVKWQAERDYFKLNAKYPEILSAIKIIRPFNVFGRNQKRGVVYEMIKSALTENRIYYSDNTTRTMTDIDFASKMSVDVILSNENKKCNIVDSRLSMTMKTLAAVVNSSLGLNCRQIMLPPDKSIQFRIVSRVNDNIEYCKSIMSKHIIELASQIKAEL